MRISSNFEISSDRYCWHLKEMWVTESGKASSKTTYYPTLELLLKAMIDKKVKGCEDLEEILDLLTVRADELKEILIDEVAKV